MSNIVLKINHDNSAMDFGKWTSTSWTIRDDCSMIMNIRYCMNDEKDADISKVISQDKYDLIFETLEQAKKEEHKSNICVLDGDDWSIKQYDENGIVIYDRMHFAIDGMPEFEKLEALLYSLVRMRSPGGYQK